MLGFTDPRGARQVDARADAPSLRRRQRVPRRGVPDPLLGDRCRAAARRRRHLLDEERRAAAGGLHEHPDQGRARTSRAWSSPSATSAISSAPRRRRRDSTREREARAEAERAREALRASEARYRFLAEAIPVQIWTATPDGRLDYVTQRVADYFGVHAERVLGEGWQHVIHPDDLPLAVGAMDARARDRRAVRGGVPPARRRRTLSLAHRARPPAA